MGDHRQSSLDSRYHQNDENAGMVPADEVVGRAIRRSLAAHALVDAVGAGHLRPAGPQRRARRRPGSPGSRRCRAAGGCGGDGLPPAGPDG
ncbi:S26 family signal peptidase [Streptomyces gougerotii]|uniref:S26 family signal peptidase n=1 Tax=Streptomyces gougerotii TaxID=53448 RepID=UPI00223A781C|nr:S26 family signal peptidase [Streptomyces gougerotii]